MLRHPDILKLRFEDLVGPEGGGTTTAQHEAIARPAEFLNLSVDISAVASGLNGGTRTFRRGRRHCTSAIASAKVVTLRSS
jgi:hypothetical protein